jgi:hypothetical protein
LKSKNTKIGAFLYLLKVHKSFSNQLSVTLLFKIEIINKEINSILYNLKKNNNYIRVNKKEMKKRKILFVYHNIFISFYFNFIAIIV